MTPGHGCTTTATRPVAEPALSGSRDWGQASVELALVLPLVALMLLALLQAGIVLRDQLLVVQAAREGAREAAVSPLTDRIEAAARRAAPSLDAGLPDRSGNRADGPDERLDVRIRRGPRTGDLATVTVSARPTRLPVVGRALGEHRIEASATMRVERAGP